MQRIFYNSDTLKIMGMSDGEESMQFPSVLIDGNYHSTNNMTLVRQGEKILVTINEELPPEAQPQ